MDTRRYRLLGDSIRAGLTSIDAPDDVARLAAALAEGSAVIGDPDLGTWFDENGLSALLFVTLREMLPNLTIIDNRGTKVETETGSDWEWWIQGSSRWFHALVQAKKLHEPGLKYDIAYDTGGTLQASKLVSAASSVNPPAVPLYALYNQNQNAYSATAGCSGECYLDTHLAALSLPAYLSQGVTVLAGEVALALASEAKSVRGETVQNVPLAEVADFAAPLFCLSFCDDSLCFWSYGPRLWKELGLPGEYDPRDLAFKGASMYVRSNFVNRGRPRSSILAKARASLLEGVPGGQEFFTDPNRFEGLPPDLIPRMTVVLSRQAPEVPQDEPRLKRD